MSSILSQKKIRVFLWIIIFLLFIAGYLLIVQPQLEKINTLKSQISVDKAFLKTANHQVDIGQSSALDSGYTVPETVATDQVVLDLRKAETESSSEVQEFSMNGEDEEKSSVASEEEDNILTELQSLELIVQVQSPNVDAMKKFVDSIEQGKRLYTVQQISMPANLETENAPLIFTLKIQTYHQ
ncbi:hypothetical protein ACSVDE_10715 [Pseudalkalibacillus sp. Hm43]|uniref:hypothetical protein n=1 Tax=Pseudalkalibacillus sp. Hm43 TaxID=3450742 RepID=UPI003F443ECD